MDSFSKLVGLYWYCYDNHSGIRSWEYRVLSTSNYRPSILTSSIEDEEDDNAQAYYNKLMLKFQLPSFLKSLNPEIVTQAESILNLSGKEVNQENIISMIVSSLGDKLSTTEWMRANEIYSLYQ